MLTTQISRWTAKFSGFMSSRASLRSTLYYEKFAWIFALFFVLFCTFCKRVRLLSRWASITHGFSEFSHRYFPFSFLFFLFLFLHSYADICRRHGALSDLIFARDGITLRDWGVIDN
jgi:hypothetical protein